MGFAVATPAERLVAPGEAAGAWLPWWAKIAAKLLLSRVLPSYAWRRRLGIGVHSFTAEALGHASEIAHDIAWFTDIAGRPPASLLELGPGDSLANALYAAAAGVPRIWLMDTADYAVVPMDAYRRIAASLPGLKRLDFTTRASLLASLNATYLTGGLASLAEVPAGTIDLTVSYSVLEHVRRAEFAPLLAELHRTATPGGLGHHHIDLMDHLGGSLNHLRLPAWFWEADAVARSGFYTNRLGCAAILDRAQQAGFETAVAAIARWPGLPTPRAAMARAFRDLPEEELAIAGLALRLRKRG